MFTTIELNLIKYYIEQNIKDYNRLLHQDCEIFEKSQEYAREFLPELQNILNKINKDLEEKVTQ